MFVSAVFPPVTGFHLILLVLLFVPSCILAWIDNARLKRHLRAQYEELRREADVLAATNRWLKEESARTFRMLEARRAEMAQKCNTIPGDP